MGFATSAGIVVGTSAFGFISPFVVDGDGAIGCSTGNGGGIVIGIFGTCPGI